MILARVVDERVLALYSSGQITGNVFAGKGQEALSAAIGMNLRRGDVFGALIRDLAGRLAFGETVLDVVRTNLMKKTSPMRGRDGNVHRGELAKGILPMISHLGAMNAVVNGVLLARRLRGEPAGERTVGVACIGDGGISTGACHESMNQAAIEKLPLVLVVANNQLSYSTFNDRSFACAHLVDRAVGYGLRGSECDGTDALACLVTVGEAIERARRGEGPQMVVAELLRLSGHGSHDDASYVPAELKARFGDCLELVQARLKAEGLATAAELAAWWEESRAQVQAAIDQAKGEPDPDPAEEDWSAVSVRDLFVEPRPAAGGESS
jgi:pyruvate dehydrogenase E1 component alpha subunit/2-oxoisovalerate dehydrogenase E1 component alpha subunit